MQSRKFGEMVFPDFLRRTLTSSAKVSPAILKGGSHSSTDPNRSRWPAKPCHSAMWIPQLAKLLDNICGARQLARAVTILSQMGQFMAYYTDLFSPETYEAFSGSDQTVSGFRISQHVSAKKIHPGDKLVCYMTKLARWIGVLEVVSECFVDEQPPLLSGSRPICCPFSCTASRVASKGQVRSDSNSTSLEHALVYQDDRLDRNDSP